MQRELLRLKLADPGDIALIDQAFRDNNIWDANGGMSRDSLRVTIKYLLDIGELKSEPDVAKIVDFAYLDDALVAIDRR